MRKVLLAAVLGAGGLFAQFGPGVRKVTVDPAGACTDREPLRHNTVNGKICRCNSLTWSCDSGVAGGPPSGAAGGDLTGSYPNPTLDLTIAHAWTALQSFNAAGTGATPTYRAGLVNSTAAAAGAQQWSPCIRWEGQGWKTDATAASQKVEFRVCGVPVEGAASPATTLQFAHAVNGGAFSTVLTLSSVSPQMVFTGTAPLFRMESSTTTSGILQFHNSNVKQFHLFGNSSDGLTIYDASAGANRFVIATGGGISIPNTLTTTLYATTTNCSSSASPAVCSAAPAGSVVVAAGATTVVVNTTAVTANSQILLMFDSSLGTKLSVTCNVTEPALYGVTARTAATSFTVTATSPITNPACFSYLIVN